eukprot:1160162-Pelagomonas_calceolata.AAC.3
MGIFHHAPLHQIFPYMCSSDIADTIAKEMGSMGGLAGSGWARMSEGSGGPLSLDLCYQPGPFP